MTSAWRVRMFDLGAGFYDFATNQRSWQRANARLVRHFPQPARRVLDVGCGTGATAFAIARACPEAEILGVDVSEGMLLRARRLHERRARTEPDVARRIRFESADATRMTYESDSFDVVTGHSFLYLVPERTKVLSEVHRVLRPGGRAVFMEPARGRFSLRDLLAIGIDPRFLLSMVTWRSVALVHERFTEDSLLSLLADAGLTPQASERTLGGLGIIASAEKR